MAGDGGGGGVLRERFSLSFCLLSHDLFVPLSVLRVCCIHLHAGVLSQRAAPP